MDIDPNDVKITINSSFQFLVKPVRKSVKDHPVLSCFAILLLYFYVYFPAMFYISPLVICAAIVLGRQLQVLHMNDKIINAGGKISSSTSKSCGSTQTNLHSRRKPTIQASMSRRTFRKSRHGGETALITGLKDDSTDVTIGDEMSMKFREENAVCTSMYRIRLASNYMEEKEVKSPNAPILERCQQRTDEMKVSEAKPQEGNGDKDEEPREEKSKYLVEWRQGDLRNLMDFGSSEIERNRRLENLIARRRAKKMLSLLPQRNPINLVSSDFQSQVSPILAGRVIGDAEFQPGSAPSVLLPTSNPFDLPYDPCEEKPVLNEGSFVEEFLSAQLVSMREFGFSGNSAGPGPSRFRRQSDSERKIKKVNEPHEQANMLPSRAGGNAISADHVREEAFSIRDAGKKNNKVVDDNEKEKNSTTDPIVSPTDEPEIKLGLSEDYIDETSSSSSLEVSQTVTASAENEALSHLVREVVTCSVPNKDAHHPHPVCCPFNNSKANASHPTKEELSLVCNDEADSPTDRDSLVYDGDEDRDVYSGDEDFWGDSPRPIGLQEFGMRTEEQEVEQIKPVFGYTMTPDTSRLKNHGDDQSCKDSCARVFSISTLPKQDGMPTLDLSHNFGDEDQEALMHTHDYMSSGSSSSEPTDYPATSKPLYSKHNIDNPLVFDVGSTISEVNAFY